MAYGANMVMGSTNVRKKRSTVKHTSISHKLDTIGAVWRYMAVSPESEAKKKKTKQKKNNPDLTKYILINLY